MTNIADYEASQRAEAKGSLLRRLQQAQTHIALALGGVESGDFGVDLYVKRAAGELRECRSTLRYLSGVHNMARIAEQNLAAFAACDNSKPEGN